MFFNVIQYGRLVCNLPQLIYQLSGPTLPLLFVYPIFCFSLIEVFHPPIPPSPHLPASVQVVNFLLSFTLHPSALSFLAARLFHWLSCHFTTRLHLHHFYSGRVTFALDLTDQGHLLSFRSKKILPPSFSPTSS